MKRPERTLTLSEEEGEVEVEGQYKSRFDCAALKAHCFAQRES